MKEEKINIDFEEVVSKTTEKMNNHKKIDEAIKTGKSIQRNIFLIIIISSLVLGIDYYYTLPKFVFLALALFISYYLYKAIKTPAIFR